MRFLSLLCLLVACSPEKPAAPERDTTPVEETKMREAVEGEMEIVVEGETVEPFRGRLTVTPYGGSGTVTYGAGDKAYISLVLDAGEGPFNGGGLFWQDDTGGGRWNRDGVVLPAGWENDAVTNPDGNQSLRIVCPDTVTAAISGS
jgi:hypothetical protein